VVVAAVYRGSPAAEAGLRRLDVVTAVGGAPVVDEASFQRAVEGLSLGATTTLTVLREGVRSQVRVGVAEAPQ
jgi:serine protease Do